MRRLRKGQVITLDGEPHKVTMVNECRATCVPLEKKAVIFERPNGTQVEFYARRDTKSISPYSEVD